jgi:hypothetical protein
MPPQREKHGSCYRVFPECGLEKDGFVSGLLHRELAADSFVVFFNLLKKQV